MLLLAPHRSSRSRWMETIARITARRWSPESHPPPHPAPQVLQQKETSWALNEVVMVAIVQ
jgi:hypothetical protein